MAYWSNNWGDGSNIENKMNIFNILKFSKYFFIKNNPIYLTYFVTNKCNLKCQHCFYWKNLNLKKRELTLEEIDKFSKNLKDILVLNITGGEPFLRKDLPDLIKTFYINKKPIILTINTNGFLTNKIISDTEKILSFYKLPLIIEISLDGIKEDHDKVRYVEGAFDKSILTFKKLKELQNNYPKIYQKI